MGLGDFLNDRVNRLLNHFDDGTDPDNSEETNAHFGQDWFVRDMQTGNLVSGPLPYGQALNCADDQNAAVDDTRHLIYPREQVEWWQRGCPQDQYGDADYVPRPDTSSFGFDGNASADRVFCCPHPNPLRYPGELSSSTDSASCEYSDYSSGSSYSAGSDSYGY